MRPLLLALAAATLACNHADESRPGDSSTAPLPGTTTDVLPDTASSDDGPPTGTLDPPATTTDTTAALDTGDTLTITTAVDATTTDATATDATATDATTGAPVDDCPRLRVTVLPGDVLNVRPTPSTELDPLGTLPPGAIVDKVALVQGEVIDGDPEWYQIHTTNLDGYVWSGLVECTLDEAKTDGFFLPLECGYSAQISQGNFGEFSHQGQSAYAFDFSVPLGTPLVAIADGTVTHRYGETKPGDPCYDGGGQECNPATNYASLLHGDGTKSIYAHLSETLVEVGQFVPRGAIVGKTGSTGWSTGPHAHVAREENCGGAWCQSIAVTFTDVPGDGVPNTGDTVVSMNCP